MEKKYGENRTFRKYFYIAFLVVLCIAIFFLFSISIKNRKNDLEELKRRETTLVNIESDKISRELSNVLFDLKYIHNAFYNNIIDSDNYDCLTNSWIEYSNQKKIYDQIRFIDVDGNEVIRINKGKDSSYLVSKENLQNKADRYYFKKTISLKKGQYYISPLDLNIEDSKIEIPYKPMIRFSTPIYDRENNLKGIIILNYLANDFLSLVKLVARSSEGNVSLINSDGYYLLDVDSSKEWGFMFDNENNNNFESDYLDEWKQIIKDKRVIISNNGIFISSKIDLKYTYLDDSHSYISIDKNLWFLVSHISKEDAIDSYFTNSKLTLIKSIIMNNLIAFIFIIIFSVFIGVIVVYNNKYFAKLKYFSRYDTLTTSFNRGYGLDKLDKIIRNDRKRNIPICLIYIDINGLKEVNDNLGHKEGSKLIKNAVHCVMNFIDEDDFVIRLGGDEFLIVMRYIHQNQAERVWQNIIDDYQRINNKKKYDFIISVSHGIIELDNARGAKIHDVLNIVDKRMYVEKKLIKSKLKTVLKEK